MFKMQEQRRLDSRIRYAKGWNEVIEVANPNQCHAIMLRLSPRAKDVYPMTLAQV